MQHEIFYRTIYPSIKASLEAMDIITVDEYKPATDFYGLDKFTISPIKFGWAKDLLEVDNCIMKVLKEYNIPYTKSIINFRMPHLYRYELTLD